MPRTGRPPVERVTLQCTACGADVVRRASDVARLRSGRVFCNLACQGRIGSKPRRGENKPCATCGEEFYAPPALAKRRFCGMACYDKAQRSAQVDLICPVCEKSFRLPQAQSKRAPVITCSRACDVERRTKNGVGRYHNGRQVIRWSTGYLFVWEPEHPNAMRNGWLAEHRWVMEQTLGRPLESSEHVHHINGKRWDNRPQNLAVLGHSEHSSLSGRERQDRHLAMEAELAEYKRRFGPLT